MTALGLTCGQGQNRDVQSHLPPGWKKILAHFGQGKFYFYISPDGRRFNRLDQIKPSFAQNDQANRGKSSSCSSFVQNNQANRGKRQRTNSAEGKEENLPKRQRQLEGEEFIVDSEVNENKKSEIINSEDVSQRRKQLSKRVPKLRLLKKALTKVAFQAMMIERKHQKMEMEEILIRLGPKIFKNLSNIEDLDQIESNKNMEVFQNKVDHTIDTKNETDNLFSLPRRKHPSQVNNNSSPTDTSINNDSRDDLILNDNTDLTNPHHNSHIINDSREDLINNDNTELMSEHLNSNDLNLVNHNSEQSNDMNLNTPSEPSNDIHEVPEILKKDLGVDAVIAKVPGNGACFHNAMALFIFKDYRLSKKLRRIAHKYMVDNWWYYEHFFEFPFSEYVGVGNDMWTVTINSPEELKQFLLSEDSMKLWVRGTIDMDIIANMFNLRIAIFEFSSSGTFSPRWTWIYPDQTLSIHSPHRYQETKEMWLFNEYNIHFDLLIQRPKTPIQSNSAENKDVIRYI